MFDIGWSEMLLVAVVMILVVGPKELPGMLRSIGKTIGNLRRMAGDFQRQFNDALKEAEVDQVQKDLAQTASIPNPLDEINKSADELMNSISSDDLAEKSAENDDQIKAELEWTDANQDKPADNKSVASKTTTKAKSADTKPAKKSPAKRTSSAKQTTAKRATPKSTTTKSATVKSTPAKRAPAKRSAAKKPAATKAKAAPAKRATKTVSKAKATTAKSTTAKTTKAQTTRAKSVATKAASKSSAKGGEAV